MSAIPNPCRPSSVDGKTPSITRVLLVAVSIAMTQGLGYAQPFSSERETPSPSSTTAPGRSADNDSTSIQHGSLDQEATSPCSSRVPDKISQSAADATVTNVPSTYIPLSGRCKFNLFLKQTYSPYTFASAGFQATWAQAMGQWPHYGGGMQGWGKRLGATLADTEARRFIQGFA